MTIRSFRAKGIMMASDRMSIPSGAGGLARREALRLPLWLWLASRGSGAAVADAPPADSADSQLSPACRSISLNGAWQLTYGPLEHGEPPDTDQPPAGWLTIAATVPGNVELDLVAAGRLEPPQRGNRIYELRKLEDYQWWYRRRSPKPEIRAGEKIELVFDGLDCLGTVWVNGKLIGRPDNMLIPHRYDVTGVLRAGGGNEVVVRIDPAVPAGNRTPHAAGEFAPAGC